VTTTTTISGVRVDLMGDVAHPDVIALRFQRTTPAHRAPTIKCDTWTIVNGDVRTEITGAVYKGEPAGPGVQETLKSHVPVAALRALAPSGSAYGLPPASFQICGERIDLGISARADLVTFFKRFDKIVQLNGSPTPPAPAETPTTPAPVDTPPATTAPTTTPAVTPATPSTAPATTPMAPATAAPPSPATP
jgi:hypothetical protein